MRQFPGVVQVGDVIVEVTNMRFQHSCAFDFTSRVVGAAKNKLVSIFPGWFRFSQAVRTVCQIQLVSLSSHILSEVRQFSWHWWGQSLHNQVRKKFSHPKSV